MYIVYACIICICMFILVHVHVHACIHKCIHVYTCNIHNVHSHACTCTHRNTHTHVHVHTSVNVMNKERRMFSELTFIPFSACILAVLKLQWPPAPFQSPGMGLGSSVAMTPKSSATRCRMYLAQYKVPILLGLHIICSHTMPIYTFIITIHVYNIYNIYMY